MESCRVYDDSHLILDSLWCSNSSPSFHGTVSMVNFEEIRGENNTERPFFNQAESKVENCTDELDGCFHLPPEKKRRLTAEQVQFLDKSFEVENKLEPDRKIQLAKELGLQPRQIAIWFQNRRARYKTKLLEKEYDSLKASYDKLKADYDTLYTDNEKLKNEVHLLSQKLLLKENGKPKPKPEPCDLISPLDFGQKNRVLSPDNESNFVVSVLSCKQEDASSSARSDVFDSDSPHYTDGNHSAVFEPDIPSDFSQEEDDKPSYLPKLELECYDDLQPNSCNFGFPVQDQGTWFWQY